MSQGHDVLSVPKVATYKEILVIEQSRGAPAKTAGTADFDDL